MAEDRILDLAQHIAREGECVIFTGAGISTESGIPDYRSQGGIWDRFRPVTIDEFMASQEARIEYWRRKAELYQHLTDAKPNAAHHAVAGLFRLGVLRAVMTQNIDGLHQKAGLPDDQVLELHGSNLRVRCMHCAELSPLETTYERVRQGDLAPLCSCGGFLKPDTVSFGQALSPDVLSAAEEHCRQCKTIIAVGSTLSVHPAASLPIVAKQNGATFVIVNLSETELDAMADLRMAGQAGEVLDRLYQAVQEVCSQ